MSLWWPQSVSQIWMLGETGAEGNDTNGHTLLPVVWKASSTIP